MRALWQRYVADVRDRADADIDPDAGRRAVIVLVTAMLCLWAIHFLGQSSRTGWLQSLLSGIGLDGWAASLRHAVTESPDARINGKIYWAVWRILGYVVVPALVIRLVLREPLASYGARVRGTGGYWRIYALLLAVILPIVFAVSFTDAFQAKYPFYKLAPGEPLWPWFFAWELLYAAQFVSLEFFFRGFVLHGVAPRFGYAAIFIMMVPYLMIHFQKPAAEALGSIVAGFVLGSLALDARSIWWGACAHITVAVTMDLLSLWQTGLP